MKWPEKQYDVILMDPPWPYYGQQDKWGAAAKFYDTMNLQDIYDLDVPEILTERGIVFCWTTSAHLQDTLSCFCEWNLTYRGIAFIWIKTKRNGEAIGAQGVRPSITKPLTELVLAASRVDKGRPLSLWDESIEQTVFASKQEHSRKPDEVHNRISQMYPTALKIELFARRPYEGWDVWGNEIS